MSKKGLVEVEVNDPVEAETDKAIMFSVNGVPIWIPKSQIDESSEVQGKGDIGALIIPEWLAWEKELLD